MRHRITQRVEVPRHDALAEHVEVDLKKMREDTKQNRGELPFIFGSMKRGVGLEELSEFLRLQGGFF